jgi:hypothetical protein
MPVTLPPGRLRLATRPLPIGSALIAMTIENLSVACMATRIGASPMATMISRRETFKITLDDVVRQTAGEITRSVTDLGELISKLDKGTKRTAARRLDACAAHRAACTAVKDCLGGEHDLPPEAAEAMVLDQSGQLRLAACTNRRASVTDERG